MNKYWLAQIWHIFYGFKIHIIDLEDLYTNQKLLNTLSDKGGGIVIIPTIKKKTYYYLWVIYTNKQTQILSTKNLTNSSYHTKKKTIINKNKIWKSLMNYKQKISNMYGSPETHKANTPMWPFISWINWSSTTNSKTIEKITDPSYRENQPLTHLQPRWPHDKIKETSIQVIKN